MMDAWSRSWTAYLAFFIAGPLWIHMQYVNGRYDGSWYSEYLLKNKLEAVFKSPNYFVMLLFILPRILFLDRNEMPCFVVFLCILDHCIYSPRIKYRSWDNIWPMICLFDLTIVLMPYMHVSIATFLITKFDWLI